MIYLSPNTNYFITYIAANKIDFFAYHFLPVPKEKFL